MTEDRQTAPLTSAPPAAASDPQTRYLPIAEHGIIGDLHSAALVGSDGTIDWFCPERFDGPSVFGALLDRDRGGYYRIAPTDPVVSTKQLYLPDSAANNGWGSQRRVRARGGGKAHVCPSGRR